MRAPADARPEPRFLYRDAVDLDTEVGRPSIRAFSGARGASFGGWAAGAGGGGGGGGGGGAAAAGRVVGGGRPRGAERARRVSAQVRPVLAGRRDPDVPGRGAAAHPGRRHRGPADRRQDPRRRLGVHLGRQRVAVRQRIDLGPDADRADRVARRRARRAGASSRGSSTARRAGGARRDAAGHAHHGSPVRDGPDHRRGARAIARARTRGYRYSFDMLGEAALTAPDAERYLAAYRAAIAARGTRDPGRAPSRRPPASRSSCRRCIHATSAQPRRVLDELGPRLIELGRAARDAGVASSPSTPRRPSGSSCRSSWSRRVCRAPELERLARLRPRRAGISERGAAVIDWLGSLARRRAAGSTCGSSRAPTGTARSSARRSAASTDYPVFTRKPTPTSPISRCAGGCCAPASGSTRSSRPTTRTRWPVACSAVMRDRRFEFQRLHGMGEELYAQVVATRTGLIGRAASMRRWASTRTCCRTWCAGCSRTAPTPPSSTASSTKRLPPR